MTDTELSERTAAAERSTSPEGNPRISLSTSPEGKLRILSQVQQVVYAER